MYEIGADYISLKFFGSLRVYKYSYRKAGNYHVENMKKLAQAGKGLNSYVNRYVKRLYD